MRKDIHHLSPFIKMLGEDGFACEFPRPGGTLRVIASIGEGWEHVSVSLANRCPTWDEMCWIKNMFWEQSEAVMQLHPPRKDYINNHPYCLHLWRPTDGNIPMPPSWMVGVKGLELPT